MKLCVVNVQGIVERWVHTFLALAQDGGECQYHVGGESSSHRADEWAPEWV